MRKQSIGIGVIDAGMADRTRPGGYRTAPAVHDTGVPERHQAAVDAHKALGRGMVRRHGSPHAGTGRGIALRTTLPKPPHALHPTGP
ncbi:hypothetical protein [Streptomyces umbrinus]|uniref:hypothetical protein n=1 Tax=Streptomyces umbrinus TaxID=67370 RepID=UPI00167564B4|nr:hypothetical protein [Streptomyces umbrinus]MCX4563434.1 hypothetical protein [Streptomyces phaeochromogenes]GHB68239.1 hypothetical protein GCM10010306_072500 [Streptomyces umbrinus]